MAWTIDLKIIAIDQQWPALGKVPTSGVWLNLISLCHLCDEIQPTLARMSNRLVNQTPIARIPCLTIPKNMTTCQ